jgi:hypothetical protein
MWEFAITNNHMHYIKKKNGAVFFYLSLIQAMDLIVSLAFDIKNDYQPIKK